MKKISDLFKTNTKEKFVACFFIIFLLVMGGGLLINVFDVGASFVNSYRTNVPTGAAYLDRIEGAIDAAELAVNEGAFLRDQYVESYGLLQLAMNKKSVTDYNYGSLYKTRHGQITFAVGQKYIDSAANSTFALANKLVSYDIPFLYIQLPFKLPPAEYQTKPELPVHITDYTNENADAFCDTLTAANITVYDIRDEFWGSGYSQNELFFDTDHHWTIDGAFLGTRLITNYLNKNYEFGIDENLYTDENFTKTTYADYFLGSMGRRVGKIYGGLDDFTLITPSFPTDIHLREITGESERVFEGSFEEAILENHYLTDPDKAANRYAAYHGDYEELIFTNDLASSDKKVLIIKDSFGIPVYSFLSLGIKEVRAIDLRLFERNVADYAHEYDPDLVILMYNADSYSDQMFDFNLS